MVGAGPPDLVGFLEASIIPKTDCVPASEPPETEDVNKRPGLYSFMDRPKYRYPWRKEEDKTTNKESRKTVVNLHM